MFEARDHSPPRFSRSRIVGVAAMPKVGKPVCTALNSRPDCRRAGWPLSVPVFRKSKGDQNIHSVDCALIILSHITSPYFQTTLHDTYDMYNKCCSLAFRGSDPGQILTDANQVLHLMDSRCLGQVMSLIINGVTTKLPTLHVLFSLRI